MKFGAFLTAAAVAVTFSVSALAEEPALAPVQQPWLKDRRYGEGIGIRTGNLEFHPSLAAELGYDSNFFLRSGECTPGTPQCQNETPVYDAWRLRVTPSFSLSTLRQRVRDSEAVGAPPAVTFSLGAFLTYNELFGSEEVSSNRSFDAGVAGRVDLLANRPVGDHVTGQRHPGEGLEGKPTFGLRELHDLDGAGSDVEPERRLPFPQSEQPHSRLLRLYPRMKEDGLRKFFANAWLLYMGGTRKLSIFITFSPLYPAPAPPPRLVGWRVSCSPYRSWARVESRAVPTSSKHKPSRPSIRASSKSAKAAGPWGPAAV